MHYKELEVLNLRTDPPMKTNLYLFEYKGKVNLIDAGFSDNSEVVDVIQEKFGRLDNLFITHGHFDHIAGIDVLMERFPNLNCHIHENAFDFLINSDYSLSGYFNADFRVSDEHIKNIHKFKDSEIMDGIRSIYTPGHTIGCSSFLIEEHGICFTGDVLFENTYGRTDLPTGDPGLIKESLSRLGNLNPETIIYPGHGKSSLLKDIDISGFIFD
ncbi:MAG: MBL fold metallo-hydrolase [Candidatus Gracilibacteria bacterium]|nr:MBL fold metallo-hydrolase [Candidatus Gracilibacteria bacterium]